MRPARSSACDVAVELFQSALLSYWNFEPKQEQLKGGLEVDESDKSDDLRKVDTTVEAPSKLCVRVQSAPLTAAAFQFSSLTRHIDCRR